MRGIGGFVLVWRWCGVTGGDLDVFVRVLLLRLGRSRGARRRRGNITLPRS